MRFHFQLLASLEPSNQELKDWFSPATSSSDTYKLVTQGIATMGKVTDSVSSGHGFDFLLLRLHYMFSGPAETTDVCTIWRKLMINTSLTPNPLISLFASFHSLPPFSWKPPPLFSVEKGRMFEKASCLHSEPNRPHYCQQSKSTSWNQSHSFRKWSGLGKSLHF